MNYRKDINREIFRAYDIRGVAYKDIDESVAYTIGLAYGTKERSLGKIDCVVGHDNRLSSDALTGALIKGIRETGMNVKYIGLVTTPMYYFACLYLKIDTGVMVTASHNPVEDNGFKIAFDDYNNACGDEVVELYDIIQKGEFASGNGSLEDVDIRDAYIERVLRDIKLEKKLKVVVDPANAAGSTIASDIFDRLDCEVIYINNFPDGSFPNHHPDPSVKENMKQLSEAVLKHHADLGIGLDGDADRLGLVDNKGEFLPADIYMCVFWDDLLPRAQNKTALFDVKCSKTLEDEIIRLGGDPFIYRTGNSYIKNMIKKKNLIFGGELSGHVFFRDRWDGFDDGIYGGIRMMEILSRSTETLNELCSHLNKYYSTPEIRIKSNNKDETIEKVKNYCIDNNIDMITVDGVRAMYEDGWALVRKSNTGPNLTLRFEATTMERLQELEEIFRRLVEE